MTRKRVKGCAAYRESYSSEEVGVSPKGKGGLAKVKLLSVTSINPLLSSFSPLPLLVCPLPFSENAFALCCKTALLSVHFYLYRYSGCSQGKGKAHLKVKLKWGRCGYRESKAVVGARQRITKVKLNKPPTP